MGKRWKGFEVKALKESIVERTDMLTVRRGGVRKVVPLHVWAQIARDVTEKSGTVRTANACSKKWYSEMKNGGWLQTMSEMDEVKVFPLPEDAYDFLKDPEWIKENVPHMDTPKVEKMEATQWGAMQYLDELTLSEGEHKIKVEGEIGGRTIVRMARKQTDLFRGYWNKDGSVNRGKTSRGPVG